MRRNFLPQFIEICMVERQSSEGGQGFEPQTGPTRRVTVKIPGESKSLDVHVFSDKDYKIVSVSPVSPVLHG